MTAFLFIPAQSANGGKIRVRLNDLPRLFAEGLDEPAAPAPDVWQSLLRNVAATLDSINFTLTSQWDALASRRAMLETRNIKSICAASQGRESQAQA